MRPELLGDVLTVIKFPAPEDGTIIVVTREMGCASEVLNQLVFLHQGRVEESGNPSEVLSKPKLERLGLFLIGSLK